MTISTAQPNEVTPELLRQDTALPPGLRPNAIAADERDVFLTGASGFVGAALLREILARSSARVFCHLRARSREDARDRLLRALGTMGAVPPSWSARVIPIVGDLTRPRLGMSEGQWSELAAQTGRIIHAAALVNHVAPYRLFRRPNVDATREILRLSATASQKEIHHISSMGYWTGYQGDAVEGARNTAGPGVGAPGYVLSKWVSDRLMEQAADRGFPVAIYRLGYVSGGWHGASNLRGWLELHLRAFARLRLIPEGDTRLAVTPVDLLSADLWALSQDPAARGRAYNLAYREQVIAMADIERAFAAMGRPIERVPGARWYAAFQAAPQDAYMQLLDVFLHEAPPEWSAERHAFAQRISAATGARVGNPAPFAKEAYLPAMLDGLVRSDELIQAAASSQPVEPSLAA